MPAPTEKTAGTSWKGVKWVCAIALLVAVPLILNHYYQWYPWPWAKTPPPAKKQVEGKLAKKSLPAPVTKPAEVPPPAPIIDYEKIEEKSDRDLKRLVQQRKKEFGVEKSVDMVVKPGEHIRVGEEIVPLDRILAEIEAQKEEKRAQVTTPSQPAKEMPAPSQPVKPETKPIPPMLREPIKPLPAEPRKKTVGYYGVYVVRPGDNLWNIHFAFLREYFGSKGIQIPLDADEPIGSRSSGIGRILKYAETMVHIFNLKTKKLSKDLNLLEPKEKIVIFNLSALDQALAPLTYEEIDAIHFDGRDLILPEQ